MLDSRVLRRIFGPTRRKITGRWWKTDRKRQLGTHRRRWNYNITRVFGK